MARGYNPNTLLFKNESPAEGGILVLFIHQSFSSVCYFTAICTFFTYVDNSSLPI